jgi:hypothetical protein
MSVGVMRSSVPRSCALVLDRGCGARQILVWPNSTWRMRRQLLADDDRDALGPRQDVQQIVDLRPSRPCTRR